MLEHLVPAAGAVEAELGPVGARARTSTPSCCGSRRAPRRRRSARAAARRCRRSGAASPRPTPASRRAAPRRRDPGSGSRRTPGSARTAPRRAAGPASSTSVVIASAWRRCTFVTRARTVSPGKPGAHEDDEPVEPRDAVPAEGERVDLELELLVALHRRSHQPSLVGAAAHAGRRERPRRDPSRDSRHAGDACSSVATVRWHADRHRRAVLQAAIVTPRRRAMASASQRCSGTDRT